MQSDTKPIRGGKEMTSWSNQGGLQLNRNFLSGKSGGRQELPVHGQEHVNRRLCEEMGQEMRPEKQARVSWCRVVMRLAKWSRLYQEQLQPLNRLLGSSSRDMSGYSIRHIDRLFCYPSGCIQV